MQTGFGRTGTIKPTNSPASARHHDAAGIGGGTAGGPGARESVSLAHGDQGGTYNGNPLMTAVGVAVFDTLMADGFLQGVQERAKQLSEGLLALCEKWGFKGERGAGLLRALVLDRDDGPAIVKAALESSPEGLLLNAPRPNLLRFMPALNVTQDESRDTGSSGRNAEVRG